MHDTIKESAVFDAGLALILVYGDSLLVPVLSALKARAQGSSRLNSRRSVTERPPSRIALNKQTSP